MSGRGAAGAARRSSLRHVSDRMPGIRRRRRGRGFEYRTPGGELVGGAVRERIEALAIPPAWERVWICPDERGHLQATGYDARGRKQYRYHPEWTRVRSAVKFDELANFGNALPRIRRRVRRDLQRRDMSREKVLACVVWILDRTLVRVGNDEYARENESYGLTTIRNRHARVHGDTVVLRFRAKSGVACRMRIDSTRAARVVRRCRELPGQELFCYVDEEGSTIDVSSGDVNDYLREVTRRSLTSKHFRTWGGSVIAAERLRELGFPREPLSKREGRRRELVAIDSAAEQLFNTRSVCQRYYVHPLVLEAYQSGALERAFERAVAEPRPRSLRTAERALLHLLKRDGLKPAGGAGKRRGKGAG